MGRFRHHDEDRSFSEVLLKLSSEVPDWGMSLREILERLEERGLLMLCMVMTIPFLLPVSIPGSSTPFGLVIAFIGVGLILDRPPRLPGRFVDSLIAKDHLVPALVRGAKLFLTLERWLHPRLPVITHGWVMPRLNGMVLVFCALMLTLPLPLPLSNTIPAYGVLLTAAGSLEKDGYFIIAGYAMALLTTVYFGLVAWAGMAGWQALFH